MYMLSVLLMFGLFIGVTVALAWVVWRCVRRPDAGLACFLIAFISTAGYVVAGASLVIRWLNGL